MNHNNSHSIDAIKKENTQMKDIIFILLTGLLAAYLCWNFYQRYTLNKALHNIYYLMGFAGAFGFRALLIFFGLGILTSPYVLTVASLIPLADFDGGWLKNISNGKRPSSGLRQSAFLPLPSPASAVWTRSRRLPSPSSTAWLDS
ncbi:MAG: hypothetical protein IPO22_14490 [Anaerolineales bacterium]|nr:hypothetical protein [Anaerolineales bacterium]